MMTTEQARDYIPQWGSLMHSNDPGACAYGAIPPATAEHRDTLAAYLTECRTHDSHGSGDDVAQLDSALEYLAALTYAPLMIEICPNEPRASACLTGDPGIASALADCRASGDVDVRDSIGVQFCIVARDASGRYVDRAATDAEMQATCEAIYFDSETDFTDRDTCETYLIWQAASDAEQTD